jgi:orotidine-5'-phosphate decarboxylase
VGAQGGTTDDLRRVFGDALPNVLPASSREVLTAGPDVRALRERAVETSASLAALLR